MDKIPNGFILTGFVSGILATITEISITGLLQVTVSVITCFVILFPIFKIGGLGAGDIKVLVVVGCFYKLSYFITVIAVSFLVGAIFSILKLLSENNVRERTEYFLAYAKELVSTGNVRRYESASQVHDDRYRKNKIHFTIPVFISAVICLVFSPALW